MKREGGFKSFGVFTKFTLSKSWQAVLLSKNHLQYSGFLHNNFVDSSFSKTSWPSQLSSLNTHFLTIRLKTLVVCYYYAHQLPRMPAKTS